MIAPAPPTTGDLARLRSGLAGMTPASDDAERIDRIRLLEELKSAVAAAQALESAAFVASQKAAQRAAGVPQSRVGRGITAQIALARRESPFRAQRYAGWAGILTTELPGTFAELQAGRITEWRATIVARETAWLSPAHRSQVDTELAPQLGRLGDRRVEARTKQLAYRLDPHGYVTRLAAAETERRVTLRPAPDAMTRLSALLPVAQGVAAYAALNHAAATATATDGGDPRSRGQIMADTLVRRLTGQTSAPDVPVEITLVMTDTALLGDNGQRPAGSESPGREEPATVLGHGPIPAAWARHLVATPSPTTPMWIRRLYRHPATGELAAMDCTRRTFSANQRLFLRITSDDTCATPWCDAPVRHIDHIRPVEHGGPTTVGNGQGLCQACNHSKQAPGWTARAGPDSTRVVTPTGHSYSAAPPPRPHPPSRYQVTIHRPRVPITVDLTAHGHAA